MSARCDICNKKSYTGGSHTHHAGVAGGQWKKRAPTTPRGFKPNLHWVTLPFDGVFRRVRVCAKCIKRARFDLRKKAVPVIV